MISLLGLALMFLIAFVISVKPATYFEKRKDEGKHGIF